MDYKLIIAFACCVLAMLWVSVANADSFPDTSRAVVVEPTQHNCLKYEEPRRRLACMSKRAHRFAKYRNAPVFYRTDERVLYTLRADYWPYEVGVAYGHIDALPTALRRWSGCTKFDEATNADYCEWNVIDSWLDYLWSGFLRDGWAWCRTLDTRRERRRCLRDFAKTKRRGFYQGRYCWMFGGKKQC